MKKRAIVLVAACAAMFLSSTPAASAKTTVTKGLVVPFQAAGDVGGGVLTPGDTFPPSASAKSTLKRHKDALSVNIHTDGLPPGAYTVWWVVFNNPEQCATPNQCGEPDLFDPDVEAAVFWATGGVVQANGVGNFHDKHRVGDERGEPNQSPIGDGHEINVAGAEVHNVIKYHGPASEDAATLHEQLTTLDGSCDAGANSHDLGPPFGVQCPDFQAVVHPLP